MRAFAFGLVLPAERLGQRLSQMPLCLDCPEDRHARNLSGMTTRNQLSRIRELSMRTIGNAADTSLSTELILERFENSLIGGGYKQPTRLQAREDVVGAAATRSLPRRRLLAPAGRRSSSMRPKGRERSRRSRAPPRPAASRSPGRPRNTAWRPPNRRRTAPGHRACCS